MRNKKLTLIRKLHILEEALEIEKIRKTAQHPKLTPRERMPTAKRADIVERLGKICREFRNEIMKNSFLGSRYVYQSDVDHSGATEFDED